MICVSCTYGDNRIGPASDRGAEEGGAPIQGLAAYLNDNPSDGPLRRPELESPSLGVPVA